MKKWTLCFKVGALIGLTLLMLIPVNMIMDAIGERHDYQRSVVRQITKSAGGEQIIAGPIIVQPYIKRISEVIDGRVIENEILMRKYFLPENLIVKGNLNVEKRKLGIYDTQVYRGDLLFEGLLPALDNADILSDKITLKEPYVVVIVADSQGIINVPKLVLNQQRFISDSKKREFELLPETQESFGNYIESATASPKTANVEAGVADSGFSRGIYALLPTSFISEKAPIGFKFAFSLQGSQSLSVVPVGRTSSLGLSANWPHPGFVGSFLPMEKLIDDKGFNASWQSSWFANNINDKFNQVKAKDTFALIHHLPNFNVNLVEMVNRYQVIERSVKYSVLFIGLTFVSFFLFEVLKGLRIHPIQYLLVGISLAMFYLILLALSEHIGFNLSYAIAALACSGLISFYLNAVFKGKLSGLKFGAALLILYGVLFGLLQLENVALLLGSIALFCILATIMIFTRNLDWYSLSQNTNGGVSHIAEVKHTEIIEEIDRKNCRLWK